MPEPMVALRAVSKRFGSQLVVDDVSFEIQEGEFFSLLGSSGCGKSTTLRIIAGFEQPDAGTVSVAGVSGGAPAYRSLVNMVFQSYALFPHLSVAENVGFGLKMAGEKPAVIQQRTKELLALVQLQDYGSRMPRQLSGGQQQRVALARALATNPRMVLLDEPLGALDLKLRQEMQQELKSIQQSLGLTFVFVTHDQEEAMAMSDRICVMHQGKAVQIGRPEEIYHSPQNRFVADFIGKSSFLTGQVVKLPDPRSPHVAVDLGHNHVVQAIASPAFSPKTGDSVVLAIRPEKIHLGGGSQESNTLRGRITRTVFCGGERLVHLESAQGQALCIALPSDQPLPSLGPDGLIEVHWSAQATSLLA